MSKILFVMGIVLMMAAAANATMTTMSVTPVVGNSSFNVTTGNVAGGTTLDWGAEMNYGGGLVRKASPTASMTITPGGNNGWMNPYMVLSWTDGSGTANYNGNCWWTIGSQGNTTTIVAPATPNGVTYKLQAILGNFTSNSAGHTNFDTVTVSQAGQANQTYTWSSWNTLQLFSVQYTGSAVTLSMPGAQDSYSAFMLATVSSVPEPATMTLLALGGIGALIRRRS